MINMMMKIRGAALGAFLLAAGALGGYALDLPLVNTQTISLAGVKNLSISYGYDDLILRESDSGDLVIREYMEKDRPQYHADISQSAGAVRIRHGRRPWLFWLWKKARAEIYLPRSFRENLTLSNSSGNLTGEADLLDYQTIDISLSSGSVFLNQVSGETVSVRVSSGNLDIKGIAGSSFISVSSGRLQIGGLSGPEHRIKTSSGRVRIGAIQGGSRIEASSGGIAVEQARGRMEAKLSSGSLSVGNFSGEGSFELSAGNLSLEVEELTGDLRFKISSGNIDMDIPGGIPFNLDAVTSSGQVLVHEGGTGPTKVSGNSTVLRPFGPSPERTIYARTSSGNITINRR